MYLTQQELLDAADELEHARHTIQNCEKLAAVYSVLDHMYPNWNGGAEQKATDYSYAASKTSNTPGVLEEQDGSEFMRAISGKTPKEAWGLMDELMTTLSVINPRLYNSVLSKI